MISKATRHSANTKQQVNQSKEKQMTIEYFKNEDGNFVCPDCGAIKKRQNSMHYHMKKHMEELNHVCKACKKGFLQKQTLDLHMRSKHSELIKDEEKKFKCPFDKCEFAALTKGNCIIHCLRVHCQAEIKQIMEVDNESKTIHCGECDKTFSSSCGFYYHAKGCLEFKDQEKLEILNELI